MSDEQRFREITRVVHEALPNLSRVKVTLLNLGVVDAEVEKLYYALGQIEGLSHVSEVKDATETEEEKVDNL